MIPSNHLAIFYTFIELAENGALFDDVGPQIHLNTQNISSTTDIPIVHACSMFNLAGLLLDPSAYLQEVLSSSGS